MAKKPNNPTGVNRPTQPKPVQKPPAAPTKAASAGVSDMQKHIMAITGIAITTFLFLKVSLLNQFTNWDDPGYVINNPLIKDISAEGIKNIFSLSNPVMGNYHPLTILTYAFDYDSANLDAYHYHLQSLIFHIATTILVYCFVWMLTKRFIAAAITAILFGLHPMHIESVAWVAGRKDVVYGFFYMASCISYLYYIRTEGTKKWMFYAGVAVLYACSLLSKPVAVVLPVTLLLIDYFEGRIWKVAGVDGNRPVISVQNINLFTLVEKLPLFGMSVLAGIKSLQDQRVFGALDTQGEKFGPLERLGLGGYALITYLWKAVLPIKLLCFYPYPLKEGGALPAYYYIYLVIAVGILAGSFWFFRKNRAIVFGILFFLVNIALLLQFIPVGGAIIADRYSYLPYIGLFFILGWCVSVLFDSDKTAMYGKVTLGATTVAVLVLGYMSNERSKVWYDGMSLWRDEIEIEPVRAPNGYNNLGFFYFNKFNASVDQNERKLFYDSSYYLLNKAIELQPKFVNPYISLGELMRSSNQFDKAKIYYYKGLSLDTSDMGANAYLGLAVIYSIAYSMVPADPAYVGNADMQRMKQQFYRDSALYCYQKTLQLKPYNPEAHSNFANFLDMTGEKDKAIVEYGVAIGQNPDIFQPYLNRAKAYQRMNKCDEAFKDFNKALQIEPKMGEIYYARSACFDMKGDKAAAQKDRQMAASFGYPPQQR